MLGAVADVHTFEHSGDALLALAGSHIEVFERQLDVLVDVEFVNKVETLENEADVALAETGAVALLETTHLGVAKPVAARRGVVEESQDVEQGGLAAARGSHNGDKFAVFDFKTYPVEGDGFNLFRTEDFLKVFYFEHIVDVFIIRYYLFSAFRMLAGLAATVRWAWKVTDTRATRSVAMPAKAKIHQ